MSGREGIEVPDHRGRTGLDRAGRGLDRNPDVRVREVELTSQGWHVLRRTTFDDRGRDGRWTSQQRETYDRGVGATVLLVDPRHDTVLLTRQFRFPAYVNDHPDGMLIETAAGLLDADDPETAIRREAVEELGVEPHDLERVMTLYMSPGSVTEKVHFWVGTFDRDAPRGAGGGVPDEGEDIEVLEVPGREALEMTRDGRIVDGKTVLLLQWWELHRRGPAGSADQ